MFSSQELELRLAESSQISSTHFDVIAGILELPGYVLGMNIADLCSGGSNTVKRLSDEGAKACGVDVLYQKPHEEVRRILRDSRAQYQAKVIRAQMLAKICKLPDSDPNLMLINANQFVNNQMSEQSIQEFLRDYQENRSRYIGSLVSNLGGLDDASLDLAFSVQGISKFLMGNWEVALSIINEILKKLRKGGELELYPWLGREMRYWSNDSHSVINMTKLEDRFDELGVKHFNEITLGPANRLVVVRP